MSFNQPFKQVKNNYLDYWVSLFLILAAYILGSIPSALLYSLSAPQSEDIVTFLKNTIGSTPSLFLLMLPWIFVFFAVWFSSKFVLKWPFTFLLTNRLKFDKKRFLISFSIWFVLSLITFFLSKNEFVHLNFQLDKFLVLLVVSSIVLLIQCIAEELVFRSFLMKWIGTKFSNGLLQAIITGVIFGYMHASNPEVDAIGTIALIYYIGTGIFLGLIVVLDDGLEISTGFHFANNLFAAIIVTKNWQVFQTDAIFMDTNPPTFTFIDFAVAFGGQLLFFLICWAIFRWKSVKRKLFNFG